jgi:hypothetical protein
MSFMDIFRRKEQPTETTSEVKKLSEADIFSSPSSTSIQIPDIYKSLFSKFNMTQWGIGELKLPLKDPRVTLSYDLVRNSIAGRIGAYINENPTITDFINQQVLPVVMDYLKEIKSSIWWGVSISEMILKPIGNVIGLKKIYTLTPDLWFNQNTFSLDDSYDLSELTIMGKNYPLIDSTGFPYVVIDTYRPEYNSTFGYPTAVEVYPYWKIKRTILQEYAIYLERTTTPPLMFKGAQDSDSTKLVNQYASMGTSGVMSLPPGVDFSLVNYDHTSGAEFKAYLDQLDEMIGLAFYIPKLLTGEGTNGNGSYAQSLTHEQVFDKIINSQVKDTIQLVLTGIIKPMIDLNFGKQQSYGTLLRVDEDTISPVDYANILTSAKTNGIFDPTNPEDYQLGRVKLGLE